MDSSVDVYFTASYSNCKHNFVIKNVPEARYKPDSTIDAFTCIIKNILQRSPVVQPSRFLINRLGSLPCCEKPYFLIDYHGFLQNWSNRIKGAPDGYNPAKEFFYNIWSRELPEYSWVRQLILPEAEINGILQKPDNNFINQTVDFYLPQADLVIEIDGAQHIEEYQLSLDRKRDRTLIANKIKVVRIPVSALTGDKSILEKCVSEIRSQITSSKEITIASTQQINLEDFKLRLDYDEVIRFQLTLLTLIEKRVLDLKNSRWEFSVADDKQNLFTLAASDLFLWYQNLFALQNISFTPPTIEYTNNEDTIRIISDMYHRYDDTEEEGVLIYTDYFDKKDYFSVSCSEAINYNIVWPMVDAQYKALLFFLQNLFNLESFRPGQLQIIANLLNLKKTIGILPTGGGKSLCYYIACLLQPCSSFAVCPITALLIDQKRSLDNFGIARTAFISGVQKTEKHKTVQFFGDGKYLMIWVSPERFQSEDFRQQLSKVNHNLNLAYAVIDEVHCLSEWGHDFRTSYLTLIQTIDGLCPQTTLVGLTATASQAVLNDLKIEFEVDSFGIKGLTSLKRENLDMHVITCVNNAETEFSALLKEGKLANSKNIGIVFSNNKGGNLGCIRLCEMVEKDFPDLKVGVFHGDLHNKEKMDVQSKFMRGEVNVMTATKAFGMGIDKDDVRYTVHYGLPWSIESFYQEAGRAGRDGKPAQCYILYTPELDAPQAIIEDLFRSTTSAERIAEIVKRKLIKKDLETLFYLWKKNNRGIKSDIDEIVWLAEGWPKNKNVFVFEIESTLEHTQAQIQQALYRLKILGIVQDWTIQLWESNKNYFSAGRIKVFVSENAWDKERSLEHLLLYIRKYDANFGRAGSETRNAKYYSILKDEHIPYVRRYARVLIEWTYDHIIYSRRRMIYNIMHLCDTYTDAQSFRSQIDNYLRISEKNVVLDSIVENPNNWKIWLEAFYDINNYEGEVSRSILTIDGFNSLHMISARYLESYKENIGLNFIYVISGLMCNDFDSIVDYEMLSDCMCEIGHLDTNSQDTLVTGILTVFSNCLNKPSDTMINILSKAVIKQYPYWSQKVYEHLNDSYSLFNCLNTATKRIHTILEEQKW